VLAAVFSALHLMALAIGLGSVWMRGRALRSRTFDKEAIRRVLAADNFWGIAALLWIGTGLTRVLAGLDKDADFYVHNGLFWVKMGLFAAVIALEVRPMITFIRWRLVGARGGTPDTAGVASLARINDIEVALVVLIVFVAAMMARGLWLLP
jgi:putative membrane protein